MSEYRNRKSGRVALVMMVPVMLAAAPAGAREPVTVLTYFLPKTMVAAQVQQQLISCPVKVGEKIKVSTKWKMEAAAVADYAHPVLVDASTGFLTKRSVGLKLNADGTISSFNSESAGQGGAVIASLFKLVGTLAPMAAGGSRPAGGVAASNSGQSEPQCNEDVVKLLESQRVAEDIIGQLEAAIASGKATPAQLQLLATKQAEVAKIGKRLTISSAAVTVDPADHAPVHVGPLDYSPWFDVTSGPKYVAGATTGFCVMFGYDKTARDKMTASGFVAPATVASRHMYYRMPVPGEMAAGVAMPDVTPCTINATGNLAAAADSLAYVAPQLSNFHAVPIKSRGLFGSREVKASFDGFGAPLELSYGSDPGAAAIAGTIDAAGGTVTAVRSAELDAINREIALREARKKLADLGD